MLSPRSHIFVIWRNTIQKCVAGLWDRQTIPWSANIVLCCEVWLRIGCCVSLHVVGWSIYLKKKIHCFFATWFYRIWCGSALNRNSSFVCGSHHPALHFHVNKTQKAALTWKRAFVQLSLSVTKNKQTKTKQTKKHPATTDHQSVTKTLIF